MADTTTLVILGVFFLILVIFVIFLVASFAERRWFYPKFTPESIGENSFQPWGMTVPLSQDEVDARKNVIAESVMCEN